MTNELSTYMTISFEPIKRCVNQFRLWCPICKISGLGVFLNLLLSGKGEDFTRTFYYVSAFEAGNSSSEIGFQLNIGQMIVHQLIYTKKDYYLVIWSPGSLKEKVNYFGVSAATPPLNPPLVKIIYGSTVNSTSIASNVVVPHTKKFPPSPRLPTYWRKKWISWG